MTDTSVSIILERKQIGKNPTLDKIDQTNYTVKALWYQWDDLDVKNRVLYCKLIDLYCKLIDAKGYVVFQLRARLGACKTGLSPPVFLYWPFHGGTSVVVP